MAQGIEMHDKGQWAILSIDTKLKEKIEKICCWCWHFKRITYGALIVRLKRTLRILVNFHTILIKISDEYNMTYIVTSVRSLKIIQLDIVSTIFIILSVNSVPFMKITHTQWKNVFSMERPSQIITLSIIHKRQIISTSDQHIEEEEMIEEDLAVDEGDTTTKVDVEERFIYLFIGRRDIQPKTIH